MVIQIYSRHLFQINPNVMWPTTCYICTYPDYTVDKCFPEWQPTFDEPHGYHMVGKWYYIQIEPDKVERKKMFLEQLSLTAIMNIKSPY